MTEARLRNVAAWYVERYDTTAARLMETLLRRVRRAAQVHDDDPAQGEAWARAIVASYVASGVVDDRRFAEATVRRLRARGSSTRRIQQALAVRGVAGAVAQEALAPEDEDEEDDVSADRVSAAKYARRRGFGPFRRVDGDAEKLRKELASMCRAGFSYDDARAVLDPAEPDLVRDWAARR